MGKIYSALGLMSGTSMDGVDASIIQTDGKHEYQAILDKYFEYPKDIYKNLTTLRDKIKTSKDLKKHQKQIKVVEKEITIFHAKAVNEILKKKKVNIDFIGFHGQTIFHNAKEKITRQLGDGKLLSKLTQKKVVYNFRQNDLINGGHGAPLAPVFHQVLAKKLKLIPAYFLNIGGITNYTLVENELLTANDIGPGMCLVDYWVRTNSKKKYDKDGMLARSGRIDLDVLWKIQDNYKNKKKKRQSFDIKEFEVPFPKHVEHLTLENGAATYTQVTYEDLSPSLEFTKDCECNLILCGGGRKNKYLINLIKGSGIKFHLIDDYYIDGDFIESQAFGYLAIRSYLKLPISFPETTGCKIPCTGGVTIEPV